MGLDLEITVGVARRLPSLTLEIALQFQMYVLSIILQLTNVLKSCHWTSSLVTFLN